MGGCVPGKDTNATRGPRISITVEERNSLRVQYLEHTLSALVCRGEREEEVEFCKRFALRA